MCAKLLVYIDYGAGIYRIIARSDNEKELEEIIRRELEKDLEDLREICGSDAEKLQDAFLGEEYGYKIMDENEFNKIKKQAGLVSEEEIESLLK